MIESQPKPDWAPLPREGCRNVEFRALLQKSGLALANLRFSENATIDPHDAPFDIDVVCLSGRGFILIGEETFPFEAGQTARWPNGVMHCLHTTDSTMETLMVERLYSMSAE